MDNRLAKLRALIIKQEIEAVLISSVPNIIYLTNFSYFSSEERDGFLLVTKNNQYLITSALYAHAARKFSNNYTVLEAGGGKSFDDFLKEIVKKETIKILGLEKDNLKATEYERISKNVKQTKHFDLSSIRIIKTNDEINLIKRACEIGDNAYDQVLNNIRAGLTEKEIALELEWLIRRTGAEISFKPIVAFGPNAAVPHHQTGNQKLKKNECVLIDFGVKYENYCSDMTRVFFFGKATPEQKKVYQTTVEAQQKATEYIENQLKNKKKAISTNVDGIARKYVTDAGFPPFNHSSHGIGLEVHESPHISASKDPLENGMVFSIEPGIYLPNKFGVRIEDLFTIKNNQLIPLTQTSKKLIEI